MEKEKKLARRPLLKEDSIYDSEADFSFLYLVESGNNYSRVPNHRRDEFNVDAVPFQPRFLLQELIFAHCSHLPRPYVRGDLVCRADWLQLCDKSKMSLDSVGFWEQQWFSNSPSSKCLGRCAPSVRGYVGPSRRARRTSKLLPWVEVPELRHTRKVRGVPSMDAANRQ